ncbi:MAG: PD40 domain-containing protein [Candidatus Coatesbacteria bacterium]|nr:MAG: PD40 domain-containing protein [Candidatus Coatesbacteria bacterium]
MLELSFISRLEVLITVSIITAVIFILSCNGGITDDSNSDTVPETPWLIPGGGGRHPDFSPDGTEIAYIYDDLYTIPILGVEPKLLRKDNLTKGYPDWSPDGAKIAYSGYDGSICYGGLYIISSEGGEPTAVFEDSYLGDLIPSWSPDGEKIVYSVGLFEIYIIPSTGGEPTFLCGGHEPVWTRDGKNIIFSSGNALYMVPATGGTPEEIEGSKPARDPTLSPDSSWVAFRVPAGSEYDNIFAMPLAGGDKIKVNTGDHDALWGQPDWSPNGKYIAVTISEPYGIWLFDAPYTGDLR